VRMRTASHQCDAVGAAAGSRRRRNACHTRGTGRAARLCVCGRVLSALTSARSTGRTRCTRRAARPCACVRVWPAWSGVQRHGRSPDTRGGAPGRPTELASRWGPAEERRDKSALTDEPLSQRAESPHTVTFWSLSFPSAK
jgi:hypothetical protein